MNLDPDTFFSVGISFCASVLMYSSTICLTRSWSSFGNFSLLGSTAGHLTLNSNDLSLFASSHSASKHSKTLFELEYEKATPFLFTKSWSTNLFCLGTPISTQACTKKLTFSFVLNTVSVARFLATGILILGIKLGDIFCITRHNTTPSTS